MFSVIFEVQARDDKIEAYFKLAGSLKPELEQIEGFVDNIRYLSLMREGWRLSLSSWQSEKALVRWRTHMKHHNAQEMGREKLLADYHLRVGQNTRDTHLLRDGNLPDQRMDVTEVGTGTIVTLVNATLDPELVKETQAIEVAGMMGLKPSESDGLDSWDIFENVAQPGELILLCTWKSECAAQTFEKSAAAKPDARFRCVRVVRDYGMFDRREAPQYYPAVNGH